MLCLMPRQVPDLATMLQDIGNPPPRALARALHVTDRTARRWVATNEPPFVVLASVFWLTRWGQSQAHTRAHNDAVLQAQIARSLADENRRLRHELARVVRLGRFDCANDVSTLGQDAGAHLRALP